MKILRWTLRLFGLVVVLAAVAVGLLFGALNTDAGQRQLEHLTAWATGGMVQLSGVSGAFPSAPRIGRIALADRGGAWLTVDNARLDWSASRLLGGTALIHDLSADKITLSRLPAGSSSQSSGTISLPVEIRLERLHIGRLELAAPVAGIAASLLVDGSASIRDLDDGRAELALTRLDADGRYLVSGRIDPDRLHALVSAAEPMHGLIANLAELPDLGALDIEASLDGPWQATVATLDASAGPFRAKAHGALDLRGKTGDLSVKATAPAMTPRADLSWQGVSLTAHLHGPFAAPQAEAKLTLDGLSAPGGGLRRLSVELHGDAAQSHLHATLDGLRLPGPRPDLFAAAPITLDADARLDDPQRPIRFDLHHTLLDLAGTAQTGGAAKLTAKLVLPDLAPLAAASGVDLQGSAALDLGAAMDGGTTRLTVDGPVAITGGMTPLPGLIGPDGRLGVAAALTGSDIALSRLAVDGSTLHLAATGGLKAGVADLDWTLKLADLHVLVATLEGDLAAAGHLRGPLDDLAAHAEISGEIASPGVPRSPLTTHLDATGLPGRPQGHLMAEGSLDGAPLDLDATVSRDADGGMAAHIGKGDWKSAHLEGDFAFAPGETIPVGHVAARMARLDELRRLTGLPLVGSFDATADVAAENGHVVATAKLRGNGVGLAGAATLRQASLDAKVVDPGTAAQVEARLQLDGIAAQGIGGTMRLDAKGRLDALDLGLVANLTGIGDAPLAVSGAARLDTARRSLALSALTAATHGETLRLLAPARLDFADGVAVDRLRLGLRDAVLAVAGRLSPTLDLTAQLSNVTANLARIAAPDLQAVGTLQAEARLTGTLANPAGKLQATARGMRLTAGPASSFPPADLIATAELAGNAARIDLRLSAGDNLATLAGIAPLAAAGALNLHAGGRLDLGTLDHILAAGGRRVRGIAVLDATIGGTLQAPSPVGSLRLSGGDLQDYTIGANVSAIDGLIEAQGDAIRISRFTGRAGPGTISLDGQLSLAAPMPIDIGLKMDKARALASDRLTADLDSDLHLRGDLMGQLALGGTIRIDNAEVRAPDSLPPQVAALDVRVRGEKPPPPPSPGPDITLALQLDSPGRIFVRGRGLDAELSGALRIGGTAAAPLPDGKFEMRRGAFNLAGLTLTFTTGEIGFDGSGKIDPTLNFVAASTNGSVTANLTISGYASAPKITLSSTPELPQDEVLAQLLFHTNSSNLSPLQLAQIAAGLAQISGAGGGFDPLNSIRSALGLDTLRVGSGQSGAGPAVQAGRAIAPGVYVGVQQNASGSGTQATVQFDLTKGLKLETNVATSSATQANATGAAASDNGASVGLTYQFEY